MIPAGWMAKRIATRPVWLRSSRVVDVYSVSPCITSDFADWVGYWRHNGWWLFDSPDIIFDLGREHGLDMAGTHLFYYEVHELEYAEGAGGWRAFEPEPGLTTDVGVPPEKVLEGYDVVTCSTGNAVECSPLSCNGLAATVETNTHCLLPTLEHARRLLEAGAFRNTEPGPFRVFAVYSAP